jgi:tetratricopeptide (TPR) repeat protein
MELGRLYTIVSMGPKAITILQKAKQLNPDSPLPYKYLAIEYVDAYYQYKTAIQELKEYVKRMPEDAFGHNFLGYLYLCVDEYEEAVKELEQAIKINPDNCYSYCKLSRCYAQLYLKSNALDPRRGQYKNSALEMLNKAQNTPAPNQRRIEWLKQFLAEKGIQKGGQYEADNFERG